MTKIMSLGVDITSYLKPNHRNYSSDQWTEDAQLDDMGMAESPHIFVFTPDTVFILLPASDSF